MTSGDKELVFNLLCDIQDVLEDGFRRERKPRSFMDDTVSDDRYPGLDVAPDAGIPREMADSGDKIAAEISVCRKCRLNANRQGASCAYVSGDPQVLAVAEAPEPGSCGPFAPLSVPKGELLEKMLSSIGLSRATCHVTTAVKCPTPGGRDPLPDELDACAVFLERQMALMRPRFVLAAGKSAYQALFCARDESLSARGEFSDRDGVKVMLTCSLQDLIKDPAQKRLAWEDLKRLKAALDG